MTRTQFRTDDFAQALLSIAAGYKAGMLGFKERYRHITEDFWITDAYCYPIVDFDRGYETQDKPKLAEDPKVHPCCGCSCSVCDNGHGIGHHTIKCIERVMILNKGVIR